MCKDADLLCWDVYKTITSLYSNNYYMFLGWCQRMIKEEELRKSMLSQLEEKRKWKLAQRYKLKVKRGQVYVIKDRCKGCGICINLCPMQVLQFSEDFNEKGYHYPILVENPPTKYCIACHTCEWHCPDFAIFVEEVEEVMGE